MFLETISPTLNSLCLRLNTNFIGAPLPLGHKASNSANITLSLIAEVLKGYQKIIKSLLAEKPLMEQQTTIKSLLSVKPIVWKKQLSLALHHTLIYYSHIISVQHHLYKPHSKGIWRKIYWCYLKAEELELLNDRHYNDELNNKTSVDYEFKRILLLSLFSSYDLAQENFHTVDRLMPLWVKHVDILKLKTDKKITCFNLNLLSDFPPYLVDKHTVTTQGLSKRLYLSTQRLIKFLTGYLTDIENTSVVTTKDPSFPRLKELFTYYFTDIENNHELTIKNNPLSKPCIQQLLSSWSRCYLRINARSKGLGFVDIVTGMPAIHFILKQQDQPSNTEPKTNSETLDSEPDNNPDQFKEYITNTAKNENLGLFLSHTEEEDDIWDKVYETALNEVLPDTKHWTENSIQKQSFNFNKSILLDYSDDGYRLSINHKKADSLKHNGLIAVRENALAPWALAQVKWLHFSKVGDLQFGTKILSHHVSSIDIRYAINGELCNPLPCLISLDKERLKLFTPKLPVNLNGKTLEVDIQGQHSQIHLKNKLLSNTTFDAYEILEYTSIDDSALQDANKSQTIIDTETSSDTVWDNI